MNMASLDWELSNEINFSQTPITAGKLSRRIEDGWKMYLQGVNNEKCAWLDDY